MTLVDEKTLNEMIEKYTKLFRLTDWRIDVEVVPASDLDHEYGVTTYDLEMKIARIQLADLDYRRAGLRKNPAPTLEQTLVHELLELVFVRVRDGDDRQSARVDWEQALNCVANAVVGHERSLVC